MRDFLGPQYSEAMSPRRWPDLLVQSLSKWIPTRCEVCRQWPAHGGSGAVCGACVEAFTPLVRRCRTCAIALHPSQGFTQCGACTTAPPPLAMCLAAVDYEFPWVGLLNRFKFQSEPAWAHAFAQLISKSGSADELWAHTELFMPVPMTPAALGERGYNQGWALAQALAVCGHHVRPSNQVHTPPHFSADCLVKIAETAPQHFLDRARRQHNLQHAFAIAPGAMTRVAGRHITLVDDIMTTGATLHAVARVLLNAGAASVSASVFARTPAPRE